MAALWVRSMRRVTGQSGACGLPDGITQIRRKVFIERKLTGFDEGKRAERHDQLADGSDAEAGFRLDRHGWMETALPKQKVSCCPDGLRRTMHAPTVRFSRRISST